MIRRCEIRLYKDGPEAKNFLDDLAKQVDTPKTQEALVLATMESAHFKLLLGEIDETKSAMTHCEKILDGLDSIEPTVHASFYRVSGDYHKVDLFFQEYR